MENALKVLEAANGISSVQHTDDQIIQMWLHGRSPNTQRAYKADIKKFLVFVHKDLENVTMLDVQDFSDSIHDLAPSSQSRILSAVKSLFSFAHRKIGILPINAAAPVLLPAKKNTLSERILSEAEVHRMLALELDPRNHVILLLLYAAALRVSEICDLKWRDVQERDNTGQITVFGKGGKTRAILLSESTWEELAYLHDDALPNDPIFTSRKKAGHLDPSQVHRIVSRAAKRAGISKNVSPHWLRHAHASHALDRGAAIHLVQYTLGHSSVSTTSLYLHARPADSSARYLSV